MLRKRCFMTQKGILAFSGGLDTSVVVKYLQEEHSDNYTLNLKYFENGKIYLNLNK